MNYKRGRPKRASRACNMCGNKQLKRDGNSRAGDGRSLLELGPPPASCAHVPGKFKKNTRRWCKGVVGRDHLTAWRKCLAHYGPTYSSERFCTVCGKLFHPVCYHRGAKWGWTQPTKPCICGLDFSEVK